MFHLPHTRNEWIIATVSAFTGFFTAGASVAVAQRLLTKVMRRKYY